MLQLKEFAQSLESVGQKSETYVNRLKLFERFLGEREIDRDIVYEYLNELNASGNAAQTRNLSLNAIRSYCRFQELVLDLPKTVKNTDRIPSYFSLKFLETSIVPLIPDIFQASQRVKEKLLLFFWFYTGLRREELATLRRENINLDRYTVTVIGKGGKARTIPFPTAFAKQLDAYFYTNRIEKKDLAFNVGYYGLYNRCKTLSQALDTPITPHTFRHSCAIHLLDSGMQLNEVQEILGHESIETTIIYLKRSPQHLVDTYQKKIKYRHK
jgi:site-specific recombinase XerD